MSTALTEPTTALDDYGAFLERKRIVSAPAGFDIAEEDLNPLLFPFQRDVVRWALRRGRAAIFADCGMGKSAMQLEWANHVYAHCATPSRDKVLVLAPLAVAEQTVREGRKFDIPVVHARTAADLQPGINITNYERLHYFNPEDFIGIVLDESSILKGFGGQMRKEITDFARAIPYRLACTATPAPNDLVELTNHAEFLEIMTGKEIIALFFTQDGNTTHAWRLKGHAKKDFWKWMASWSVALRRPSDLGYSDDGFILPPLNMHQVTVPSPPSQYTLFPVEALTLEDRRIARRESLPERVKAAAELVNASDEQWVVWCDLNAEGEALVKAIPGAVEVQGSDDPEYKERAMLDFAEGKIRVLVTKPSIAGHGLNWQNCHNTVFVGLSDSFEQLYQAVRRFYRFGQTKPVEVYLITAETEGAVVKNIERKERQATDMMDSIVAQMKVLSLWSLNPGAATRDEMVYEEDTYVADRYKAMLGDSIKRIDDIETESVGLSVFSPPFPAMYAYTNSAQDIGNSDSIDEFMEHFAHLAPKLLRVTMPGRSCCVHLMQLTAMLSRDGYIGIKDYRGRTIEMMEQAGWIYAGEATINKNPQVQAVRNKERGLLFKTLATDSSMMRMALADYLLIFRKPGENPNPIRAGMSPKYNPGAGWISEEEWISWAHPVWNDIRETDVLNVRQARDTDDERHLCPLQLGVIERCIKLFSAPGELVYDPFMGIGSTGYRALQLDRRFVGSELKRSYYETSLQNLADAAQITGKGSFLSLLAAAEAEQSTSGAA